VNFNTFSTRTLRDGGALLLLHHLGALFVGLLDPLLKSDASMR